MITRRFFIIVFIISSSLTSLFSQEAYLQFTHELNIEFDKKETKSLEKASEKIVEAEHMLNQAVQAFDELTELEVNQRISDNYQDALELLFKASESFNAGYGEIYAVFKSRGDDFWEEMERTNHRAAGMDKAVYYERTARKNRNRSLIRHEQVLESDRFPYSMNILKDALELDRLAIRNVGRAVQICMDYPVEYNYGWEDDKTLEEVIALLKDPNVNEPPDDIFGTLEESADVDSVLLKEIIFKVQIAAHTDPLSEEYLTTLYKGGLKIDLIYEEAWYKYSIGRYGSFDEAEATRRECNVAKAFVVAYQEGKKIGTQEAIELAENMTSNVESETLP